MALGGIIALVRPWQQYKNLIVFVPLVFSQNATNAALWPAALLAFGGFVLLSAAAYAWNDAIDASRDRSHPRKRERPVARGVIVGAGLALAGLLVLMGTNVATVLFGAAFLVLQWAYNLLLKHQVIWDVVTIGVGFVVRAAAGTTALEVGPPTVWLFLCTFLFAMFLALSKRRHELLLSRSSTASAHIQAYRSVLRDYTVEFVETTNHIVAALLLGSYFLYTVLGTTPWMMLTIPFAVYGVLRYLFLARRRDLGDEPELVFQDAASLINAVAWVLVVIMVLEGWPQVAFEQLQAL
jgi:4-hydroxybenzoate polyprenyltransferase